MEDVTRRMVKLEVPAWREPLPAAVAAAGEGAAEVPAFAPLYAVYAPVKREPATATLIPYFAGHRRRKRNDRLAARLIFALGYSGSHGHHDMSARRAGGLLLGRAVCVRTGWRHLRRTIDTFELMFVRRGVLPMRVGGADPAYRGRPNRTLAAECGACGRRHHHV